MAVGKLLMSVAVGALLLLSVAPGASGQAERVRWDIVHTDFAANTQSAGGMAFAHANNGSLIELTGSGTFVEPASGGPSSAVTGGGNWDTFDVLGTPTGSGTYQVIGLVRWQAAGGTPPSTIDLIGGGVRIGGLAVLRIAYSDGDEGILVVSCHLGGTPNTIFEGVTASKGLADYWNRVAPVPGVDGNRTIFHR